MQRQIQTLTEKFALFERAGNKVTIDEIGVVEESPLYRNGKFFTMGQVIEPRPNLYEYYEFTNPVFSNYIDSQDTIIIDKEKSKPLGFDENGNETTLDYPRILQLVKDSSYTNFIGVEYEGTRLSEREGILATKNLLLNSVASSK